MWYLFLWIISLLSAGYFIFSTVFVLVMCADLQNDWVNPIDMAEKVNLFWIPDVILFSFLTTLYLLTGYWWVCLVHLPILGLHIYTIVSKQHRVDPTTILQGDSLHTIKIRGFVKLGFAIISFFLYLYMLISTAVGMGTHGRH